GGGPGLPAAIGEAGAAPPDPPGGGRAPPARRVRRRRAAAEPPVVERRPWGFLVSGPALERLVGRTRFETEASLERFQVALDRLGVSAALEEAGALAGDAVRIGELEFEYQP